MKAAMLTALLVALAACRGEDRREEESAMAGMTAEEHARMQTAAPAAEAVHLTASQARAIGVTFAVAERGPLAREVRTVGQVVPAEPNLAEITAKIDGFVERLFVDATGVTVRRGQPLLALYSPMLVAAQEELLAAARLDSTAPSADSRALLDASRRRLAYWDISAGQIERLERTGDVTKTLTLEAPVNGVVLEKMVVAGQAVMAGMKLYRIADLSTVWIEGSVFEQDVALIRPGTPVRAELSAYPGRAFAGRVSFVWPTVDEASRAVRVRVAFANPDRLLKPGMYATLGIDVPIGADVVSVPAEAVVMTGTRNLVYVAGADGMLVPREVTLGPRAGDRLQVLRGLEPGERVVASANFLVDAEARLGAGGQTGMPGMPEHKP
jgi:Cu(I)/Ag(I) efflux system membrane fusion protein